MDYNPHNASAARDARAAIVRAQHMHGHLARILGTIERAAACGNGDVRPAVTDDTIAEMRDRVDTLARALRDAADAILALRTSDGVTLSTRR